MWWKSERREMCAWYDRRRSAAVRGDEYIFPVFTGMHELQQEEKAIITFLLVLIFSFFQYVRLSQLLPLQTYHFSMFALKLSIVLAFCTAKYVFFAFVLRGLTLLKSSCFCSLHLFAFSKNLSRLA